MVVRDLLWADGLGNTPATDLNDRVCVCVLKGLECDLGYNTRETRSHFITYYADYQ